jgi:hypothetical protein
MAFSSRHKRWRFVHLLRDLGCQPLKSHRRSLRQLFYRHAQLRPGLALLISFIPALAEGQARAMLQLSPARPLQNDGRGRFGSCENTTWESSIAASKWQRRKRAVPLCRRAKDLEHIFSLQFERTGNRDNTVSFQNLTLQIEPVRWRATLADCTVTVHQHLNGSLSLRYGPHSLGRYDERGCPILNPKRAVREAVEKTRRGKVSSRLSHRARKSRKVRGIPTFPPPRPAGTC